MSDLVEIPNCWFCHAQAQMAVKLKMIATVLKICVYKVETVLSTNKN